MADFEKRASDFAARSITVIGGSADSLEDAERTRTLHALTMPLAYGLDAADVAATTGAFYDARRGVIHATGFIVRPGGRIAIAVYSTGGVGRLAPLETLNVIRYLEKKGEAAEP